MIGTHVNFLVRMKNFDLYYMDFEQVIGRWTLPYPAADEASLWEQGVGVMTKMINDDPRMSFLVPAKTLKDVLKAHKILLETKEKQLCA